ncbi:UDP-N-acetylglucosamine 2-epimerase [Kluyvera ascorbata]|uniref:UDP-N-acetylglucosamine 2-epimerase n=1 Tax=Kluyvera ascorbata TaxID=51288 RepID=UPI002ABC9325|nr:UDP-N-acetylglucosamine 2-epimerase [Kluyvera ascorbata]MDZ4030837.1 UDP-N-acetylglucosamine 2-epimerase [Kluyvera ascorbata]
MKKNLLYVTGSRAEYGIMKRLLISLRDDEDINLSIIATGMHCDSKYGNTYKVIEDDGFHIDEKIDINLKNNTNADVLHSMSICQSKFGYLFQKKKYDAVILLGDRYEIFSVAIAAAIHNIPIIHLHGGEKTLGNYDEFIRHSITKMARLHLASTEEYKNRIIQMGEQPESVVNIGALGAENALSMPLLSKTELIEKFALSNKDYFVIVFHPETFSKLPVSNQVSEVLKGLMVFRDKYEFIFIGSNSDTGSDQITEKLIAFCDVIKSRLFTSVRPEEYLSLVKFSAGLIGNSSSGLIEVPSLKVPTINIGDRQKGRVRGGSVIDCECSAAAIENAINLSQQKYFRERLENSQNPYYKNAVLESAIINIKRFLNTEIHSYKDFYDIKS